MKLVIGGSSGFVSEELIRDALKDPAITSIVALGRREASAPAGANATKIKFLVVEDFENYTEDVKAEIANADACIWTIAVTPMKLQQVPFDQTIKISRDYATYAIKTLASIHTQDTPLRFIYMSGHFAPRSRDEVPPELKNYGMIEYGLVRGEAETLVLKFAEDSKGTVQSCVVKPGIIDHPGIEKKNFPGVPHNELVDVAACLLDQVTNGFEKDTLSTTDLTRIGEKARAGQ